MDGVGLVSLSDLLAVWVSATVVDGRPGAASRQSRVKPHQCSRSISAHWVLTHPSLCRKDSVRLMGVEGGRVEEGGAGVSGSWPPFYLVRLFTSCSSSTGFHCWWMVTSCTQMPRGKKNEVSAESVCNLKQATRAIVARININIVPLMSLVQAGANLIRFLPQWLSKLQRQAEQFCLDSTNSKNKEKWTFQTFWIFVLYSDFYLLRFWWVHPLPRFWVFGLIQTINSEWKLLLSISHKLEGDRD